MGDLFKGIAALIIGIGALYLLYSGVFWIAEKFMGVRLVSRTGFSDAIQSNYLDSDHIRQIPADVINSAIALCRKKGYSLTANNVLEEVDKMRKGSAEVDGRCQKYLLEYFARQAEETRSNLEILKKIQKK